MVATLQAEGTREEKWKLVSSLFVLQMGQL
jgi:hypothetical protein